ncbi:MAG: hypothetical protein Q8P11_01700 [bacterium]|nr:hypothetical protein [bacterium]
MERFDLNAGNNNEVLTSVEEAVVKKIKKECKDLARQEYITGEEPDIDVFLGKNDFFNSLSSDTKRAQVRDNLKQDMRVFCDQLDDTLSGLIDSFSDIKKDLESKKERFDAEKVFQEVSVKENKEIKSIFKQILIKLGELPESIKKDGTVESKEDQHDARYAFIKTRGHYVITRSGVVNGKNVDFSVNDFNMVLPKKIRDCIDNPALKAKKEEMEAYCEQVNNLLGTRGKYAVEFPKDEIQRVKKFTSEQKNQTEAELHCLLKFESVDQTQKQEIVAGVMYIHGALAAKNIGKPFKKTDAQWKKEFYKKKDKLRDRILYRELIKKYGTAEEKKALLDRENGGQDLVGSVIDDIKNSDTTTELKQCIKEMELDGIQGNAVYYSKKDLLKQINDAEKDITKLSAVSDEFFVRTTLAEILKNIKAENKKVNADTKRIDSSTQKTEVKEKTETEAQKEPETPASVDTPTSTAEAEKKAKPIFSLLDEQIKNVGSKIEKASAKNVFARAWRALGDMSAYALAKEVFGWDKEGDGLLNKVGRVIGKTLNLRTFAMVGLIAGGASYLVSVIAIRGIRSLFAGFIAGEVASAALDKRIQTDFGVEPWVSGDLDTHAKKKVDECTTAQKVSNYIAEMEAGMVLRGMDGSFTLESAPPLYVALLKRYEALKQEELNDLVVEEKVKKIKKCLMSLSDNTDQKIREWKIRKWNAFKKTAVWSFLIGAGAAQVAWVAQNLYEGLEPLSGLARRPR